MVILKINNETDDSFELMQTCRNMLQQEGEEVELQFVEDTFVFWQQKNLTVLIASCFGAGLLFGAAICWMICVA